MIASNELESTLKRTGRGLFQGNNSTLNGLWKIKKNLRILDASAEIPKQILPNTRQKVHPFSQPAQKSFHRNHCVSEMDSISVFKWRGYEGIHIRLETPVDLPAVPLGLVV
jgi:hypothetical protein